ncbi:MAG: SDR family oxidoreductase [Gammaproteobacteria bacterium]|nr:SDR family oxidoreductase [Gammaproteobacteria bacterium]
MGRVAGKVALITGGASGLGRADAEVLAREGAGVVLTDINDGAGESAAEHIRAAGGRATFMHHDVSDEAQWAKVIAAVRDEHGRLDVLVNNAGIAVVESIEQCSLDSFHRQNAIMSDGVFLGCKHALPLMHESGGGSIINMSSIASHLGYPVFFAYSAAKGAVRAMSKAIAVHCQMNGYKIRVNSIHPGAIDTPMIDETTSQLGLEDKTALSPVGLGQPEDVANVILFLASDESRFINGTEIIIDNALSIQ